MRTFLICIGAVVLTGLMAYAVGVRIFVIRPIGAIPDGRTLILTGVPGLKFIDSPDAFCLRTSGNVTLLCRGATAAGIVNRATIVGRLPYSLTLDTLAGTPTADR